MSFHVLAQQQDRGVIFILLINVVSTTIVFSIPHPNLNQMEIWNDDFDPDVQMPELPLADGDDDDDVLTAPFSQDYEGKLPSSTIPSCVSYSPRSTFDDWGPPPGLEGVIGTEEYLCSILIDENTELGFDPQDSTTNLIPETVPSSPLVTNMDWNDLFDLLIQDIDDPLELAPPSSPTKAPPTIERHYQAPITPSPSRHRTEWHPSSPPIVALAPPQTPKTSLRYVLTDAKDEVISLFCGNLHHTKYLPFFRYLSYLSEPHVVSQYSWHYYHESRKAITDCRNRSWRDERLYGDIPTTDDYQMDLCRTYLSDDRREEPFTELQAKLLERLQSKIGKHAFNSFWMHSQQPPPGFEQVMMVPYHRTPTKNGRREDVAYYWTPPVAAVVPMTNQRCIHYAYRPIASAPTHYVHREAKVVKPMHGASTYAQQWENNHRWTTPATNTDGRDDMETEIVIADDRSDDASAVTQVARNLSTSSKTWV